MIDEARQIAGVIYVCVSDDYRIDRRGVEWWFLPIPIAQVVATLKQSAIDEHPGVLSFNQVLRSGNSSGCTPK